MSQEDPSLPSPAQPREFADSWAVPGSTPAAAPSSAQPAPADPAIPVDPTGAVIPTDPAAVGGFVQTRAEKARRRRTLVGAITAGAVVLVGGGVALHLAFSGEGSVRPLPLRAGGLVLETDAASKARAAMVSKALESFTSVTAQAGAYGPSNDGHFSMLFVELPSSASATLDQGLQSNSPSEVVSRMLGGSGMANMTTETSSDPSAALSCGTMSINSNMIHACAWAAPEGIALAYFISNDPNAPATPDAVAATEMDALAIAALKS